MSEYTGLWIAWLVMFAVIEGAALIKKSPNDTFSAHVWKWASVKGKSKGWIARRTALLVFVVWLGLHFWTGGAV